MPFQNGFKLTHYLKMRVLFFRAGSICLPGVRARDPFRARFRRNLFLRSNRQSRGRGHFAGCENRPASASSLPFCLFPAGSDSSLSAEAVTSEEIVACRDAAHSTTLKCKYRRRMIASQLSRSIQKCIYLHRTQGRFAGVWVCANTESLADRTRTAQLHQFFGSVFVTV